jgi:SAM-dependent methyltransferase
MADDRHLLVDPSNAEQADDWDGEDGDYWAGHQEEFERLLEVFDPYLVEAAAVRPDHRVLDVGCGTGATSRALAARATSGAVVGVDLSSGMLERAQRATARVALTNVEFLQADAQVHPFTENSFDTVVSRLGCMFFGDPGAAFANIAKALRPGGRLAMLAWAAVADNAWLTALDLALEAEPDPAAPPTSPEPASPPDPDPYEPGPFSLTDPALITTLLHGAGFGDVVVQALEVPMNLGTRDQADAFLLSWLEEEIEEAGRDRAVTSLHRMVLDHETDAGVLLGSATWLVTARREG